MPHAPCGDRCCLCQRPQLHRVALLQCLVLLMPVAATSTRRRPPPPPRASLSPPPPPRAQTPSAAAATTSMQFGLGATSATTALRQSLLSGYDRTVPPSCTTREGTCARAADNVTYSHTGTDVFLSLNFFKVETISIAQGSMQMKVWARMTWRDLRLAWDANATGLEYAFFKSDEIWTPDIQPYNGEHGFQQTLEDQLAKVSSSGTIFYSRPGTLQVLCRFSGLVKFPYDHPVCPVEIGGWIQSGAHQGLKFDGAGYSFSSQEVMPSPAHLAGSITSSHIHIPATRLGASSHHLASPRR